MNPCERCGAPSPPDYELHDYCAVCSKTLCSACMAKGCCGHAPAKSGSEEDNADELFDVLQHAKGSKP